MTMSSPSPMSAAALMSAVSSGPQSMTPIVQITRPPVSLCAMDESPFDNVLRTDDLTRAQTLVSIGNFLQTYPPRMTLDQYIAGRRGDDGFSQTLIHLIRHSIYPVTCHFLQHVIKHFSLSRVFEVLDAVSRNGVTGAKGNVMHLAVMRGELDLIKRLVGMGFDLEARDSKNQTPIFYLIQGEDPVVLKAIVPGTDGMNSMPVVTELLNDAGSDCESMQQYCVLEYDRNRIIVVDLESTYSFDEKVWRYLVKEKSVNLNIIDDFGDTPLTLAIKLHRQEVMQQLLTLNRVQVDLMSDNRPPFHIYCEEGILSPKIFNQFMVRTILTSKDSMCQRNYEGKTVLHSLLNNQAGIETPKFLVPFVLKLRDKEPKLLVMQDAAGETPLMSAITRGYPFELLVHLIPGTSDGVNLVNHMGFNALALSLLRFQGESNPCDHQQHLQSFYSSGQMDQEMEQRAPYRDKWRWDHQLSSNAGNGHPYAAGSHNRRYSCVKSPQPGTTGRTASGGKNGGLKKVPPDECLSRAEADLHQLIDALTEQKGKLDQGPGVRSHPVTKSRESILSFVVHNKKITHQTMSKLVRKGLITSITAHDVHECVIEFRLDLLDELTAYAAETKHQQMTQVIKKMDGLAINLLDHVYTFRHIYTSVRRQQDTGIEGLNETIRTSPGIGNRNGTKPLSLSDSMSEVSRSLARQNLSRVKPLIARLFDHFGHDVNHVIKQTDPHTKREVESFTLIHALIQSNSWIELPDVVEYILREKSSQLDIDVCLPGRGTPLNYAIRLGQFGIADRILDLNPDVSQLNLSIPVLPLKRNFSEVMRRLIQMGIQIPREFAIQNIRSGIDDAKLEVEFFDFMSEARKLQKRSAASRRNL